MFTAVIFNSIQFSYLFFSVVVVVVDVDDDDSYYVSNGKEWTKS